MITDPIKALQNLFYPKTIAIAGASANHKNLGSRTLKLIKDFGFGGSIYAVNPKAESSSGVPGYSRVVELPTSVDLCFVVVPARAAAEVIKDCSAQNVPVAQILTGGFGETGQEGQNAERRLVEASAGRTRLVGPNCIGVYSPDSRLTLAASADPQPGTVAIASQSGGLSIDMILQARARGLKLSKLVSIGNCMDLDPVDFLNYFAADEQTSVIGMYIEGINRGKEFLASLRRVASRKPVVILKGGRTSQGAKSAASHTNSLAGDFTIWKTAADQTGVLLVQNVDEFLAALTALQPHVPRPAGRGLALVGNGGGSTVLATDLSEEHGLHLAELSIETNTHLGDIQMPAGSTVGNPTDVPVTALNKAGGESFGKVIETVLDDDNVHGMVIHFNLLPFINYSNRKEIVIGLSRAISKTNARNKAVYLALRAVPDPKIESLREYLLDIANKANLPCFQSADEAVVTMARIQWYTSVEFDSPSEKPLTPILDQQVASARNLIERCIANKVSYLSQKDCFDLMSFFGISHPPYRLVRNEDQAVQAAEEIGFPVVMKIDSPEIVHKSDAGGVQVGIDGPNQVRRAFGDIMTSALQYNPRAEIKGVFVQDMSTGGTVEMICGLKRDPVFGPVVLVGLGGVLVELLRDVSLRILPLNDSDPGRIWQELNSAKLLAGYRGQAPADTDALEDLIHRLAVIGETIPEISELDLNPVKLGGVGRGVEVLDCRIFLYT